MEENIAAGINAREVREAAGRMFRAVSQIEEESRDMRRTQCLEHLLQDLRYAVRLLGKSPAFIVVIVLTVALSIGANSAIFGVFATVYGGGRDVAWSGSSRNWYNSVAYGDTVDAVYVRGESEQSRSAFCANWALETRRVGGATYGGLQPDQKSASRESWINRLFDE